MQTDPAGALGAGTSGAPAPGAGPWWTRIEEYLLAAILATMVVLPAIEVVSRLLPFLHGRVPATIITVQELTLWLGLLGAALAARHGRHLAMAPIAERLSGRAKVGAAIVAAIAGGVVAALYFVASIEFVRATMDSPNSIGGLPEWAWELALPIGFGLVALRLAALRAGAPWRERILPAVAIVAACGIALLSDDTRELVGGWIAWPGILGLGVATLLGAPLFAIIGGVPLLLFLADGEPIAALPNAAYLLSQNPMYASIPLFTLAGYVLAEGGASKRLVRLFKAVFGWLPGGLAVAAACVCAFFTTFTGGSGVTILALGGLLLPALIGAGYRERYSVGLLTTSGSLGLLFPPSVPVILYAVVSKTPIEELFAGALVPGALLLLAVAATGVAAGWSSRAGRAPFVWREVFASTWEAKWELLLPLVVLGGLFGGYTTPLEAAALTALYAIVTETLFLRELSLVRDVPRVMVSTAILMGGVMMILAVALGLTSYLVDADVPLLAASWVEGHIDSRFGFLLALNVFLLVVGCLMDIFSAIVVVVPIITPIAAVYGIDPIHLGVIFIANLELGYLTPPVGLNLFLASIRFEKPLLTIYRSTMGFFLILLAVVIAITYIPWLTAVGHQAFFSPAP